MNIWNKLMNLLPKSVLLVGVVSEVVEEGYYYVVLSSGGTIPAKGQTGIIVDTRVFIQDGVIQGNAPDLGTVINIDV